ncbi:MAG TPA: hypothetical protein DCF63_03680, partial [Planctomycetaceae bacterium]|nr:hypothetical protein [Planctomycetaceae bacterium]
MNATGLRLAKSNYTRQHRRSGAVLVAVLTCTFVSMALITVAFSSSLSARRQCRWELQRQQAAYLIQAGRLRATEQLHLDPSYSGEVWDVTSAFTSYDLARIDISPIPISESSGRQYTIVAQLGYANAPERTVQITRTFLLSD